MAELQLSDPKEPAYWNDPSKIWSEYSASVAQRSKYLEDFKERVRRYEGPGRHHDFAEYDPENHAFEWIALVLPQIIAQLPRITIGSKKPEVQQMDALALELAINRWCRDTNYKRHLDRIGVYWSFFCGVSLATIEKYGDVEDSRRRPRLIVLDPEQFGMDALARWPEEARFMFHECVEDRDALMERAKKHPLEGWDVKVIERMARVSDDDGLGRPKASVPRNEVRYIEMWVPELNDEDDEEYHGKILTLSMTGTIGKDPQWVRKPRPFYGPAWGPYTLYPAYTVPRSAWPMAPLQAHEGPVRELNVAARANSNSARRRKTIMLYDLTQNQDVEKVLNTPDGGSAGLNNFEKSKFDIFQNPGVTEDALLHEQYVRQRVVRIGGMSDPLLSQSNSGSTATADAIASRALDARMAKLEECLYAGGEQEILTIAWYLWHGEGIIEPMALGQEAHAALAERGIQLPPGAELQYDPKGNQGKFEDLELEIEMFSMRRSDEAAQQGRALQMLQLLTPIAQMIPMTPWMPWDQILKKIGEIMHWPDMGQGINYELAYQVGAAQLQAQLAPDQGTSKPPPRMSGDVGGGGGSNGGYGSGAPRLQRPSEMGQGPGLPGNSTGAAAGRDAKREAG